MNAAVEAVQSNAQRPINTARYARCISASKRARWDIDADVIRGRQFDLSQRFLPNGLSKVDELPFLSSAEARLLTQVQGRTYAQIFGLVERFITALVDAGYLADRALGSLVRFSFWMLGGAGLALAEAPEADRPRLREEWRYLIGQTIAGLRAV